MSSYSASDSATRTDRDRVGSRPARRETTETKSAFKTTELIFYVLAVAGVLVASALTDSSGDGQGFGAAAPGSTSRC